jgi:hypothetical protein
MEPCGRVVVLGAYWGGNPYHALRMAWPNAADHLSARHVLFKSLVDAYAKPGDIEGAQAVVCIAADYELPQATLDALKRRAAGGARLFVLHARTTVNGQPLEALVGKDAVRPWRWDAPPDLGEPISPARGRTRGLRFAAWRAPDGKRLALHAVNYNVGIRGRSKSPVVPLEHIPVRLRLPDGLRPRRVVACDPDRTDERLPLEFALEDGRIAFTIPRVRVYKVIEIQ